MTPFQLVLLSSALTAVLIIPAMLWNSRREQRRKGQDMMRTVRRIANERTESQAILASLDVGIVAYGSDDRLIATNPVASEWLTIIPDTLSGFLDRYGTENGMRAAHYLGREIITGEIGLNERLLRLVCQHHPVRSSRGRFGGHVVTVQDFTDIMRQEERRKAFVANVSHELKTPLTTIKSYSETLLDWGINEKAPGEIKADIERIYDDSIRMERLIADLLLLSSLDSSGMPLQASVFDLVECARQISERLKDQADAREVNLEFYSMTREPAVFADKNSIERVLSNLIINAIRYTEEGGLVQIYVGTVVDDIYVKVKDNGIGIPKAALSLIFQRFYRVDKTGSRQFGGTGLGLPIALELARMHRGRIDAESELAEGSQFTLYLPKASHLLRLALVDLQRKELPVDAITKEAASAIRDWAGEPDGGDGAVDMRSLLEIIDKKVNNGINITPSN
jgi:two-component system sensor histidine kinase VicK